MRTYVNLFLTSLSLQRIYVAYKSFDLKDIWKRPCCKQRGAFLTF